MRVNFIDWRPDQEPSAHDGLVIADNVLHDTEGYKPLLAQTAGAFATTAAYSTNTTFTSLQVRPVGIGGDLIFCGLREVSNSVSMSIGFIGSGTTVISSKSFGSTMLSAGACRIVSFSLTELENHFVVTAKATGELEGGTTVSVLDSSTVAYTFE